ncbi:MAG: hypothetical protein RJB64_1064, partial [Pseudomonadota bacterium]
MTALTPGMATTQSAQGEIGAMRCPMQRQRLQRV